MQRRICYDKKILFSALLFLLIAYISLIEVVNCIKEKNQLQIKLEKKLHIGIDRDKVEKVLKEEKVEYSIDKNGEMNIFNVDKHKYLILNFDKKYKYTGICFAQPEAFFIYLYKKMIK